MSESQAGETVSFPVLIFKCQRESHPFHERTITIDDIIKVGRSVARLKPSETNAIFDCKVLSRNHAVIWYKNGREALFHEQQLDSKLDSINQMLQETREISEAGWQAMLNEERLLQKLDLYENQLAMIKQNLPEDSLQANLYQALEDKFNLEKAGELMLARVLSEKTEALSKAITLESRLSDSERECTRLREHFETTHLDYRTVVSELETKSKDMMKLEQLVKDVERQKVDLESEMKRISETNNRFNDSYFTALSAGHMKETNEPNSTVPGTTEKGEHNPITNGLDNGPVESSELFSEKVEATERLHSSSNLNTLDKFCDIHDQLTSSGATFEHILDSTSDDLSRHLTDSVRQFQQSVKFVTAMQNELTKLSDIVGSVSKEPDETSPLWSMKPESDSTSPNGSPLVDSVYFLQQLTVGVATCHSRAGSSLSSYCQLQKRPAVETTGCNTSGDICLPITVSPAEELSYSQPKPDELPSVSDSTEPPIPTGQPHSTDANSIDPVMDHLKEMEASKMIDSAVQSSMDPDESDEVFNQERLQLALHDVEVYKHMAEEVKHQDATKAELLLSVREECDALRTRIAQIESDVATSREDHQRLIVEARRTRTEADELRHERDQLNKQVSGCTRRIEELQTNLSKLLLLGPGEKKPLDSTKWSSDTHNTAMPVHESVTKDSTAALNTFASAPGSGTRPNHSVSESGLSSALPSSGSMVSLFAIIPIMVVLCAIMMYIFSKFIR